MLKIAAFLLALGIAAHAEPRLSDKKGHGGDAPVAAVLHAKWYYNWGPRGESRPGLEFVPMVKSAGQVTPETLGAIKASGAKVLLGFNEPERSSQGNVSVEKALELWPQLTATGLRLGSPAPSSDGPGMDWLARFMEGADKRKLRVDFIAVHWYRSASEDDLERWLKDLHRRYRRPIWLTEFNAYYAGGDRDRFARNTWKILDRLSIVERYAYFTTPPGEPGSLWKPPGYRELLPLGENYRDR